MERMREAIANDAFLDFRAEFYRNDKGAVKLTNSLARQPFFYHKRPLKEDNRMKNLAKPIHHEKNGLDRTPAQLSMDGRGNLQKLL